MKLASLILLVAAAVLAPAHTPLVLNKEGSLAIVDPASKKVLATVRTGDQPHEVEASADGKLAFVSNYGGGHSPSGVDIAGRKEPHRVALTPLRRAHGLSAIGNTVYFTAEANKVIGRYDAATNKVDMVLGTGQNSTHMVLALPDESRIFTSNIGSDSITIIDRAGVANWNETVVSVGQGPEG